MNEEAWFAIRDQLKAPPIPTEVALALALALARNGSSAPELIVIWPSTVRREPSSSQPAARFSLSARVNAPARARLACGFGSSVWSPTPVSSWIPFRNVLSALYRLVTAAGASTEANDRVWLRLLFEVAVTVRSPVVCT